MTPKPQANRLDEIVEDNNILVGTGAKLTEIGYERLGENIQSAKQQIQALITEARNNSLLDLENWAILHDLDAEMILDGIEHMVISNLQVPDQPRRDNSERLTQLKKGLSR